MGEPHQGDGDGGATSDGYLTFSKPTAAPARAADLATRSVRERVKHCPSCSDGKCNPALSISSLRFESPQGLDISKGDEPIEGGIGIRHDSLRAEVLDIDKVSVTFHNRAPRVVNESGAGLELDLAFGPDG